MLTPPIDYSKGLSDDWTEEDKIDYDLLRVEAKRLYPNTDEFIIHVAIIAHINHKKGKRQEATKEQIEEEMKKYRNANTVIETPVDPTFKFDDTMTNLGKNELNNNLDNIQEQEQDDEETEIL